MSELTEHRLRYCEACTVWGEGCSAHHGAHAARIPEPCPACGAVAWPGHGCTPPEALTAEAQNTLNGDPIWPGVHSGCPIAQLHVHAGGAVLRLYTTADELPEAQERERCSQCGQLYTERACGPTHAIVASRQRDMIQPLTQEDVARIYDVPPDMLTRPPERTAEDTAAQQEWLDTHTNALAEQIAHQAAEPELVSNGRCPMGAAERCPDLGTLERRAGYMLNGIGVYSHEVPPRLLRSLVRWLDLLHRSMHTQQQLEELAGD